MAANLATVRLIFFWALLAALRTARVSLKMFSRKLDTVLAAAETNPASCATAYERRQASQPVCSNPCATTCREENLCRVRVVVHDLAALLQCRLHRAFGLVCHLPGRGDPRSFRFGLSNQSADLENRTSTIILFKMRVLHRRNPIYQGIN